MVTRARILLTLSLFLTTLSIPLSGGATPWTPVEWRDGGKLRNWVRDTNNNFVDDLIEAQTGPVDVIVDLNGCAGEPSSSPVVKYLNSVGTVSYVGRYVSFAIVRGVDAARVGDIAARPEVAMVELAEKEMWLGDNFRTAKVQASPNYTPDTLQDAFGWSGALDGHDVGIAFLDTGAGPDLDYAVSHGYNALTDTEGNPAPDPVVDHATWMGSWIFTAGGIAPQASLIDMKVGDEDGPDAEAVMRALEKVYERHRDWGINVVTLMFSGGGATDGREARQQLIDFLSGHGISVVASGGGNVNNSAVVGPGTATRAISVSAADINLTVDRSDDTAPFQRGPRADDGDADGLDELKPEIIMPTAQSGTAVSNSIAAATTAGLSALVLQQVPALADFDNKAAGSVKDLLIRSAEPKGTADTAIRYPRMAATWDEAWGFGELDAHRAFHHLTGQEAQGRTNLSFRGFDGSGHPSTPWYHSLAIETQSERDGANITAGVPDRIFARVVNNGPTDANRVRVSFGFYPFTAGVPKFYDIGSQVIDLENGGDLEVSMDWTPPDLGEDEDHGCILVTLDYGYDRDFSARSNVAQKNVRVEIAASPAKFSFNVENPLPKAADVRLEVTNPNPDWDIELSDSSFALSPYDCAVDVTGIATPGPNVKPGTEALFFVTAYAKSIGQEKDVEIGGVALKARYQPEPKEMFRLWVVALLVGILTFAWIILRRKKKGT